MLLRVTNSVNETLYVEASDLSEAVSVAVEHNIARHRPKPGDMEEEWTADDDAALVADCQPLSVEFVAGSVIRATDD